MNTVTLSQATIEQGQATPWNKQGNRSWEAEWLTDVERAGSSGDGVGHRMVSLRAAHHEGAYRVTASIATRMPSERGFKITQHALFHDPHVTLFRETARFGQKRLKEIFDAELASFDPAVFYAAYEVAAA